MTVHMRNTRTKGLCHIHYRYDVPHAALKSLLPYHVAQLAPLLPFNCYSSNKLATTLFYHLLHELVAAYCM